MRATWYGLILMIPAAATAQSVVPVSLSPADGVIDSISQIWTVRELSDGRVLVPGPWSNKSTLVDFATGTRQEVPDVPFGRAYRLGDDSTFLVSRAYGWIFLDGVHPTGMLPATTPLVQLASDFFGADSSGSVLAVLGGQPASDSGLAVLISRSDGARQPVTSLWEGPPARGGVPAPLYVVYERAVLAFDGWIAVLRAHPYRVDWRRSDGTWILGKPMPVPVLSMDSPSEKNAVMVRLARVLRTSVQSASSISDWPRWSSRSPSTPSR